MALKTAVFLPPQPPTQTSTKAKLLAGYLFAVLDYFAVLLVLLLPFNVALTLVVAAVTLTMR
jgi:hypothetical protein